MLVQVMHSCAIKFLEWQHCGSFVDGISWILAACLCSCAHWITEEYCLSHTEVESGLSTINNV
ncbi:hypothetical protein MKW98_030891 [Papaver atlanticum]|uniref:Uncharacterized protein n=1 Tax=Papaver atlanticum TaxID=357466 RepID=A0AAD4TBV6_9MAGN|nr:hypothetical protein MKW98_030891 [Papaver atlanticum]